MSESASCNHKLRCAIVAATLATTPVTLAQEEGWALEEVLVTAQRRVESLQKAPLSVTALTAETIAELGIVDIEALTRFAPNVTVNKLPAGSSASTVRIRGVANPEVVITTDPKVTLYVDGVLIAKSAGSMLDLIDLERIEVLRGPQGTLFGRNAVGGAIAVHTREPTEDFEFSQTFDVGNLDLFESQTMINVPLMDNEAGTLLGRAVYMYHVRDGWVQNEAGDDWGTEDRQAGRINLAWAKGEWSARYTYDKTKWREKIPAPYLEAVADFTIDGTPKNDSLASIAPGLIADTLAALGREETTLDEFILTHRASVVPGEFIGDHDLDIFGHALTVTKEFSDLGVFGDVTLKSITAFRELDSSSLAELDGTPVPLSRFDTIKKEQDQTTQEFQWVGNTFDDRLDYVLGFYYFDETGVNLGTNTALDFRIGGFPQPFSEIAEDVGIDNEAWAIFGQGTLADVFVEGLDLTLGLRYTQESRGVYIDRVELRAGALQDQQCDPAAADFDADLCYSFTVDQQESFDNLSPMANVSYQWNDQNMSYFRIATGYQSGGFNGRATSFGAATTPYKEETSISYELGFKSSLWKQRLNLNTAIFYTESDDLQLASFPPGSDNPNVGTVITNAGKSHIYGGELEMVALLTPDLEMYFNYAYLKLEFDEYVLGFDDVDGDGIRETPVDVADETRNVQAPENSFGFGLRYAAGDIGIGKLSARVDMTWQDDILFAGGAGIQTVNAPELDTTAKETRPVNQQSAYTLVDARIILEKIPLVSSGNLKLALWGRNLTDEDYRYASVDLVENLGIGVAHYGDPRTYGLTLSYDLR
ncbi:MAG: iron complex outermembrane receptor protein [Halioglobus sp.]|jgi:iron complex outermembrane receptor protein